MSCLISLFYIKPQPVRVSDRTLFCCLISLFYIKPQPVRVSDRTLFCCLISLFYIKPQLGWVQTVTPSVVLYLFSTSNHNRSWDWLSRGWLSYISFLHQTTTRTSRIHRVNRCLISLFYIKPQHAVLVCARIICCLISLFYIKPQLERHRHPSVIVVLYLFSTSNHNRRSIFQCQNMLSYISFLHQTTTWSSCFNGGGMLSYISFLHQTTTKKSQTLAKS